MSREFINRIEIEKDGVYISVVHNPDNMSYHTVKNDLLTDVYKTKGQKGLDIEVIKMLFNNVELKGTHISLRRYLYAYYSKYATDLYKEYLNDVDKHYEKINIKDNRSLCSDKEIEQLKKDLLYQDKLEEDMYSKIAKKCDEYDLIMNVINEREDGKPFSYYAKLISGILEVSEDYGVCFDSYCPFDLFGSDDEVRKLGMSSFSDYYREILFKNNINVDNITTREKSDGKYIVTINNTHNFDIKAWEKIDEVIDNVETMINELKEKEKDINYE